MAHVIVTLKIMPESPEIDLAGVESAVKEKITTFGGTFKSAEQKPIAFGLKSLNVTYSADENLGGTDELEKGISGLDGVNSCEAVSVSRALG